MSCLAIKLLVNAALETLFRLVVSPGHVTIVPALARTRLLRTASFTAFVTRTSDQGMCDMCYACTFTVHVITHPSSTHTSPCHPYTTLNTSEGEDKYKNQLYLLPKAFEAVSHLLAYLVTGSFSQVLFAKSLVNPCYKSHISLDLDASGTKLTDWIAPNRAIYHNEWIVMTALADATEPSNATDTEEKDHTSADSDEIFSDLKTVPRSSLQSSPPCQHLRPQALPRRKIH